MLTVVPRWGRGRASEGPDSTSRRPAAGRGGRRGRCGRSCRCESSRRRTPCGVDHEPEVVATGVERGEVEPRVGGEEFPNPYPPPERTDFRDGGPPAMKPPREPP